MAGGGPGVRRRKVTTGNPSTPPEPPRADPVLPVAVYEDIEEVYAYLGETYSGQQSAIFTSKEAEVRPTEELSKLLDVCDWSICRVNINMQCSRGPDCFPVRVGHAQRATRLWTSVRLPNGFR